MMYDGYDGEDEETRRQRREGQDMGGGGVGAGGSWWERSGFDATDGIPGNGMGSPESGYGPGGVENPAYGGAPAAPKPVKEATSDEGVNMTGRGILPAAPPPPPAAFQPPAPAPAALAAPTAAPAPAVKQPGITDEVTRILMGRLKELQNPQDVASDPLYQQAVRAYQVGQLRSADKQRKALAERSAATTGTTSSGGFNVGVRGIQERAGENAAQYRSGLAMDRLSAREQQLVQYIQMARAVGQDDLANQLELQRLQLQQELGRGDLALRSELGRGNLGLGYDQLGYSYADLVTRANRDATLAVLNGGG